MSEASTLSVNIASKQIFGEVCVLDLVAPSGEMLPAFSAGAHIDLHLPGGWVRAYSLCNDPAERHRYQVAVLRDVKSRGGSLAVHDSLAAGQRLTISAPRNLFALDASASHHLLLGGGIGVTPLLSMAHALRAAGQSHQLVWSFPTRARTAFLDHLWPAHSASGLQLHIDDEAGALLQFEAVLAAQAPGTHLYVCGPQGFIDAALDAARAAGWGPDRLHWEQFGAKPIAPGAPFTVRLAKTQISVEVGATESISDVLARHGVVVQTSCEQGVCGTCLTPVLQGEPDHQDLFLTPEEQAANKLILPCCSRSKTSELVLDL